MKGKRFTEEQVIAVLTEAGSGPKIMDVCRKYGISDAAYCNWKAKYHGMELSDLTCPSKLRLNKKPEHSKKRPC